MSKIVSVKNLKISQEKADFFVLKALENLVDNLNAKIETKVSGDEIKIYIIDNFYSINGLSTKMKEISVFEYLNLLKYGMKLSGIKNIYLNYYTNNNKINYIVSNELGKVRRKNYSYEANKNR